MDKNKILKLAVKAMNDTMGPEGYVPAYLLFDCIPRFPSTDFTLPTQQQRMDDMQLARRKTAIISTELRIWKALSSRVSRNTDLVIEVGDLVRVFRETDKRYVWPYPVIRVERTHVFIVENHREVKFNKHQVLPVTTYDSIIPGEYLVTCLHSSLPKLSSNRLCKSSIGDRKEIPSVLVTEVLRHNDPWMWSEKTDRARKQEIENLVRRGTWELVLEEDVPPGSNIISGSFVITSKDVETEKPIFKARFVAHGHRDAEKHNLVHDSTNVSQSSVRLLIELATIMGFDVWTEDISQACFQSASKLLREVYLRPNKHLQAPVGYILKLLRPLYGLADSSDYSYATFAEHLGKKLFMRTVASDMSLFSRRARGQLTGLLASYVDETLACGDSSFSQLPEETRKRFEVKSREYENMRFSGVYIDRSDNGFDIHQRPYIDHLKPLPSDESFVLLRQYRAQLSWLIHSRPDVCMVSSKLAQVTETSFNISHVEQCNTTIRYLQDTRHLSLRMPKLDPESLHVRAYTDASFSTNSDHSSQLGYIVLPADEHDSACVLHYASYKSRRVARSVLGAEMYAFAHAFDFAYCPKTNLEKLLDRRVSLSIFTDSKSLFDVITKCSQTQERRLRIDLQAVCDAYAVRDISNVGFIRGPNNPADGLTKIGEFHALYHMLLTGKCDFIVEQWVIRCQNAPPPAKYLSNASICYVCSCISDVIHPSRNTTSSFTRSNQNASSKTVLVEIMESFSLILMEFVRTVSIFYTNGTAKSLNTVILDIYRLMLPYSQCGPVISTKMTLQTRT